MSPSLEANTSSTSQEILLILSNPEVHYRIHKSPSFIHTLSQISSVHVLIQLLEDQF